MESYPRFLQDVGRGRGPVPFPCTPSPDRARPKSVRNAPGLKCQGCPRPFRGARVKVLLEVTKQALPGRFVSSSSTANVELSTVNWLARGKFVQSAGGFFRGRRLRVYANGFFQFD